MIRGHHWFAPWIRFTTAGPESWGAEEGRVNVCRHMEGTGKGDRQGGVGESNLGGRQDVVHRGCNRGNHLSDTAMTSTSRSYYGMSDLWCSIHESAAGRWGRAAVQAFGSMGERRRRTGCQHGSAVRRLADAPQVALVPVAPSLSMETVGQDIIVRGREILGGTPVFCGTRVPLQALLV
jgi:hypothetical protein